MIEERGARSEEEEGKEKKRKEEKAWREAHASKRASITRKGRARDSRGILKKGIGGGSDDGWIDAPSTNLSIRMPDS